jgi:hypothetical protein
MKLRSRIWLATAALTAATVVWSLNEGMAADKAAIDPTGTWKVTTFNLQTNSKTGSEETLKLKLEGGKLSGTITHRSNSNGKEIIRESPIKETKFQGGEISFTVSHPPHVGAGPDVTKSYQGKISGEVIKGKLESEWSGATIARNWEAKRVKE